MPLGANMKECGALTKEGVGCRNRHLPFSRYCWRHQDLNVGMLGTVIGLIGGALFTIMAVLYQERSPSLEILCSPPKDGNPSVLACVMTNSGRAEARDIFVSFNNMLPLDTKVQANPELGITIQESERPPDPQIFPEEAKLQKAFAVRIPRIAVKDSISFQVTTSNADNLRTAQHILRIRESIKNVLKAFGERLSQTYPEDAKKWDFDTVLSARIKEENFFMPAHLSYEKGREEIKVLSESERLAKATNQDLYAKYKKEFIDIYQGRPEFKAPVIRIKTLQGESTYASFPPYIKTCVEMLTRIPTKEEIRKARGTLTVDLPIPVPNPYGACE
jgi:hypothetical protein